MRDHPLSRAQDSWKLADKATEIDAARLLTWRADWMKDERRSFGTRSTMPKLFASDVTMKAMREATQVFGGYGYGDEYPVERFCRDAKITEICEGTSEVQCLVISQSPPAQLKAWRAVSDMADRRP